MNKLIFIVISCFFIIENVKADLGSCVIYYGKFYLKDGTSFKGCFEYSAYFGPAVLDENNSNEFCSDEGIFEVFKMNQKLRGDYYGVDGAIRKKSDAGKMPVFKNFHLLELKPLRKKKQYYTPIYGFTTLEDIVLLDSNEIEKIIFWEAKYSKRAWLTSEIVIGSKGMIDTVRAHRYWNSIIVDLDQSKSDSLVFDASDPMAGYILANYNPQNNSEELKRLARLKMDFLVDPAFFRDCKEQLKIPRNEPMPRLAELECHKRYQMKIQKLKKWFWKRGIVLIRINGTC